MRATLRVKSFFKIKICDSSWIHPAGGYQLFIDAVCSAE